MYRTGLALAALMLSACMSPYRGGVVQDSAPSYRLDPDTILDATPRKDAITRAGNKNPYTVLGKTYHLLPSSEGYRQQGIASWYGTKFHGRPTANGEAYNLYGMTAAHRTLPIPAYVKVTNLANNRTAIVRVNDRGPFHSDRIIDLSYAAALKLGFADQGTARVLVEAISPKPIVPKPVTPKPIASEPIPSKPITPAVAQADIADTTPIDAEQYFLQVGAFKSLALANNLRANLLQKIPHDVLIKASEPAGFYRVQLGPLSSYAQVQQVSEQLLELDISQPKLITE